MILSSKFSGLIVFLYGDAKEERFTQVHFATSPELDDCVEGVTDTFDLIIVTTGECSTKSGIFLITNSIAETNGSSSFETADVVPYWLL